MKFRFGIMLLGYTLGVGSFSNIAHAEGVLAELSPKLKRVVVNEMVSAFAGHFADTKTGFKLLSASVNDPNNKLLEKELQSKGYKICVETDLSLGVCQDNISWFITRLDEGLDIYHTGLRVNGEVTVGRFYELTQTITVAPLTDFYLGEMNQVITKEQKASELDLALEIINNPKLEPKKTIKLQKNKEPMKPKVSAIKVKPITPLQREPTFIDPKPLQKEFWQVQLMASVDEVAMEKVQKHFDLSGVKSVLVYESPFFKLRVGSYQNNESLWRAQKEYRRYYPGAFAVKTLPSN